MLLDVIMPGMSAVEALKEIRRINKSAKILACSGHGTNEAVNQMLHQGKVGFLGKPYGIEQLSQKLATCLAARDD